MLTKRTNRSMAPVGRSSMGPQTICADALGEQCQGLGQGQSHAKKSGSPTHTSAFCTARESQIHWTDLNEEAMVGEEKE